jgi:hypothetical protein
LSSAEANVRKAYLHDVADILTIPVGRVPNGVIVEVYPYRLLDIATWSTPRRQPQQLSPSQALPLVSWHVVDLGHDGVLLAPGSAPLVQYLVVDAGVAEVHILLPRIRAFQR